MQKVADMLDVDGFDCGTVDQVLNTAALSKHKPGYQFQSRRSHVGTRPRTRVALVFLTRQCGRFSSRKQEES